MHNISDDFPDVLRIESSGKCNFKCIHCPTGTQPNNRPVLSEESFGVIVDQFTSNRFIPRVVVLYHGGESLLNKKLSHFIHIVKSIGVKKTVITPKVQPRGRPLYSFFIQIVNVYFIVTDRIIFYVN